MKSVAEPRTIRLLAVLYGAVAAWFAPAMGLAVLALLGFLWNPRTIGIRHMLFEVGVVSVQFGGAALASVGLWRLRWWGPGVACVYNVGWAGVLVGYAIESDRNLSFQDSVPLALVLLAGLLLLPAVRGVTRYRSESQRVACGQQAHIPQRRRG
ncbi:MAG: hypothetical protein H8K06_05100 [Nitrospira sp.]|nr:hypothetical protein [Nitrospira sp.]